MLNWAFNLLHKIVKIDTETYSIMQILSQISCLIKVKIWPVSKTFTQVKNMSLRKTIFIHHGSLDAEDH